MDPRRTAILTAIARGATVEEAARSARINPASVWESIWKEEDFKTAYTRALWTNCQAQIARLEQQAIDLSGDPDTSDLSLDFDASDRAIELAIRARVADHNGKRRHVATLLNHWRWRCSHLAASLFGQMLPEDMVGMDTGGVARRDMVVTARDAVSDEYVF